MKKLLTILFLLGIGYVGFGQSFADNVKLGAYVIPQFTWVFNNDDAGNFTDEVFDHKLSSDMAGGLSFEYKFAGPIGFYTGIMYSSQGGRFESVLFEGTSSEQTVEGKKRLKYLKVPLNLKFDMKLSDKIGISGFGGPQFSYLAISDGAILTYYLDDQGDIEFYDLPEHKKEYYESFSIDVVLGGGVDYYVTPRLSINGYVRFDYGINDIENKSAVYDPGSGDLVPVWSDNPERAGSHNFTAGLQLGATYSLQSSVSKLYGQGAKYRKAKVLF